MREKQADRHDDSEKPQRRGDFVFYHDTPSTIANDETGLGADAVISETGHIT